MSASVFDHPFLSGLLGDLETAALMGVEAELAAMVSFEAALARAEAAHGVIPMPAADVISQALGGFRPDMAALRAGSGRDGVVVPELVRQMRAHVGTPHGEHLHLGATSQDVIDTALVLRLRPVVDLFERRISAIAGQMEALSRRFGAKALIGRTRMQAAIPITAADRVLSWREPLLRHLDRLGALRPDLLIVQFGGSAGTLDRLGDKAAAIRASLAAELGLADASQWHSQRDRLAEFANWLSLLTGTLGKFGQDSALMAQTGEEIRLSGGGTSSAMPHKQNPVGTEVLVALARFNAAQLAAMHQSLVHEQERSGAAWTLEWLVLPGMVSAAGAATRLAAELASNIESLGAA